MRTNYELSGYFQLFQGKVYSNWHPGKVCQAASVMAAQCELSSILTRGDDDRRPLTCRYWGNRQQTHTQTRVPNTEGYTEGGAQKPTGFWTAQN